MPLGINGYNDAFKAFTDFATQAKSGSAFAQISQPEQRRHLHLGVPKTASANGRFRLNLPFTLAVSVAFQALLMVKYAR